MDFLISAIKTGFNIKTKKIYKGNQCPCINDFKMPNFLF